MKKQLQSAPIPPLVPKTTGMKDPISMSSTLCWYFRFFSSSCSLKNVVVVFPWLHLELTYVTMTSKNAVTPRDQKPPALKSSLACGLVTALLRLNRTLLRGCSCGSTSTLVQTFFFFFFQIYLLIITLNNYSYNTTEKKKTKHFNNRH